MHTTMHTCALHATCLNDASQSCTLLMAVKLAMRQLLAQTATGVNAADANKDTHEWTAGLT